MLCKMCIKWHANLKRINKTVLTHFYVTLYGLRKINNQFILYTVIMTPYKEFKIVFVGNNVEMFGQNLFYSS